MVTYAVWTQSLLSTADGCPASSDSSRGDLIPSQLRSRYVTWDTLLSRASSSPACEMMCGWLLVVVRFQ